MPTWNSVLAWGWSTRAGKVIVVVGLLVVGACLARLVLGPVDDEPAASGQGAADEQVSAPTDPTDPAPGAAAPDVADAFAHGWLAGGTTEQWYGRLLAHATPQLADELAGTSPAAVPTSRITGERRVEASTADTMEVTYPAEGGAVRLWLVHQDGRWLVDQVRWEAA